MGKYLVQRAGIQLCDRVRFHRSLAPMALCTHGLFTAAQSFRLSLVSGSGKLMGHILIAEHPDLSVWNLCADTYMWQEKTVFLVYRGNHIKSWNAQHQKTHRKYRTNGSAVTVLHGVQQSLSSLAVIKGQFQLHVNNIVTCLPKFPSAMVNSVTCQRGAKSKPAMFTALIHASKRRRI